MPDIFISYAHNDNMPVGRERGWVDWFLSVLVPYLFERCGRRVEVWHDGELQGVDQLTPTIKSTLQRSKFLVSVLSPSYVNSTWCNLELHAFTEAAQTFADLSIPTKSRIVKVIKTPKSDDPHYRSNGELADLIGYEFYSTNPNGTITREFDPRMNDEARLSAFIAKVVDVADHVSRLLDSPSQVSSGRTVYLAETTRDASEAHDDVRRFLLQEGHNVLPETQLPYSAGYVEQTRELIERCDLSVHVLGENYGEPLPGEARSFVEAQYDVAVETAARKPGFRHLPWLPREHGATDPRQCALVTRIEHSDPLLLIDSVGKLKAAIGDALAPPSPAPRAQRESAGRSVYLLCAPADRGRIEAPQSDLEARGYDVIVAPESGSEADVRREHEENLRICDAVLIYHGGTPASWARQKMMDLKKIFGQGRKRPFAARGLFVADPQREGKEDDCDGFDVVVLPGHGAFASAMLDPFVELLANKAREAG